MSDSSPPDRDEFYVGYLPTPPKHLQVLRVLVMMMAVWILAMAGVISFSMRDPGEAVWDTSKEQTWTGTLVMEPYPMLLPDDGSAGYLVVEMGKRGAQERVAPFARTSVSLRGFLLERDGRRIIELTPEDPDDQAITAAQSQGSIDFPPIASGEHASLVGEIVDGKCYLGAMKPGDGMTHKACATLCLRGGLPPMVVTQTEAGHEFRLLILNGRVALPEELLAFVAEPVRVEGELIEFAGIPAVNVDPGGISLVP